MVKNKQTLSALASVVIKFTILWDEIFLWASKGGNNILIY